MGFNPTSQEERAGPSLGVREREGERWVGGGEDFVFCFFSNQDQRVGCNLEKGPGILFTLREQIIAAKSGK